VTFRSKFLATLVVLTVSAQPITICAAQTKSQPATIVTHVDIIPDAYKPQSEENAARLLRSQRAATQHDADLISYVVLQQNGASNHFTIVETWRNTRSYELHQGADHTVEFRNQIQPFLGGPFDSLQCDRFALRYSGAGTSKAFNVADVSR
jgi:quinol monooxygenase YgiN